MKGQEAKMVPLRELQTYKSALEDHHQTMSQFFNQFERGYMPQAIVETLSVKPLVDLHACLTKILKDNNIESVDNTQQQQKVADVLQSIVKVQTQLINYVGGGQLSVSNLLKDAKVDIIRSVGGSVSSEFENLLGVFTSNSEAIEHNFSSLRKRIEDSEHNVIEAIREERDQRMQAEKAVNDLRQEMQAMSQLILDKQSENKAELKEHSDCGKNNITNNQGPKEHKLNHQPDTEEQKLNQILQKPSGEQDFVVYGFEFFKNYKEIKSSELRFETDFEYTMVHPWHRDIVYVKVILEMCTTYKGVPYGPALINYKDPDLKSCSFRGIGVFNQGKLHMTPFLCIAGDTAKRQYSKMVNGRIDDGAYGALFNENGDKQNVDSLKSQIDVSGWCFYLGQIAQNGKRQGKGKSLLTNGSVFIGNYNESLMQEGTLYELQSDSTYSLFDVKYDNENDVKNRLGPSKQNSIFKNLISKGHKNMAK